MKKLLLFLTLLFTVNTLLAQSFTEGTDMAGTGTGLTYTVSGPSIVIGGALNTPADGQDRFRVLVPAGCQITGVSYTMTDPAGLNGTGFFHFNSNNDVSISGQTISNLEIVLSKGWNLISGSTNSSIIDDNNIIIENTLYSYGVNGYVLSENVELEAGKGYWIKTNSAGTIIITV